MENIYGLPQPLTGNETVTIQQMQNGQYALCTMPISNLISLLIASGFTAWANSLATTAPATSGMPWNNNGVISLS